MPSRVRGSLHTVAFKGLPQLSLLFLAFRCRQQQQQPLLRQVLLEPATALPYCFAAACFKKFQTFSFISPVLCVQSEAKQKQTAAAETLQQLLKEAAEVKQAIAEANEQAKVSKA